MPTGVIINSLSIVLGGIFGALLGHKLSHRLKTEITLIFGICAMAMGINAIGLMENMPAVIFSIIIGTTLVSIKRPHRIIYLILFYLIFRQ